MTPIELPMTLIVILLTSVLRILPKYPKPKHVPNISLIVKKKDSLCVYPTDPSEVSDIIKSMKSKKSAGHDGITSELIKIISDEVSTPISVIINRSIDEGTAHEAMKLAEVVPTYL